jgi:DNA-directed RNA polymerase subunit RPC12/RpoP
MQKGEHTWDLFLHYYSCPQCGLIIENRENDQYKEGGVFQKKLTCPRCSHHFIMKKIGKPTLAPLIGQGQPVEVEWSD